MYDDLVKRLRDLPHLLFVQLHGHEDVVYQAADAIEEFVRNADKFKWISVAERLPEDLTRAIVFCEDGVSFGLCEHLIADGTEVVEWHDFLHYPITPTHWMPLPEPPKEET